MSEQNGPDTTFDEAVVANSGQAFGASPFERLLLAIISAHPDQSGKTSRQRLDAAMKMLVGERATPNPEPGNRDDRALIWMGSERHIDKANRDMYALNLRLKPDRTATPPRKPRSDLALAEEAADLFFGQENPEARHAIINRLREKFSGSYARKQGKGHGVDFEATYIYRAVEHDYVQESLEAEALKRVCDELAEWGVATKL